jgi:hypothetical protein
VLGSAGGAVSKGQLRSAGSRRVGQGLYNKPIKDSSPMFDR